MTGEYGDKSDTNIMINPSVDTLGDVGEYVVKDNTMNDWYQIKFRMTLLRLVSQHSVSYLVGAHTRTPGNYPVQAIYKCAQITAHQRNTVRKPHGSTIITLHDKYGPVRATRS